jgi:hypothetical protein
MSYAKIGKGFPNLRSAVKSTPLGKGGREDRPEDVGEESDEEERGYGNVFVTSGSTRLCAPTLSEDFELDPGNKESSQMLMDYIAALESHFERLVRANNAQMRLLFCKTGKRMPQYDKSLFRGETSKEIGMNLTSIGW